MLWPVELGLGFKLRMLMVWSLELGELGGLEGGKDPILSPVKTPTVARAAPPCDQSRSAV